MTNSRLQVVAVDSKPPEKTESSSRRLEAQARFERLWLQDPEQFNPLRNCMEQIRLERTWKLLETHGGVNGKEVVDLGCGSGILARRLRDHGAKVTALDLASNALKYLQNGDMHSIRAVQGFLPHSPLNDEAFDIVVCTDTIAYLAPMEYRLLFSELSRLVKPNGLVVCSTPLDIHSDNPLERFAHLAETEFVIERWILSYHRLTIRLRDFFEAPARFARASQHQAYHERALKERTGLAYWWFSWNSAPPFCWIWSLIQYPALLFAWPLRHNRTITLFFENICRLFSSETGMSHAIWIGKRRPLFEPPPQDLPEERKHKREVWE